MRRESRVDKLERAADAIEPERPTIGLSQDGDDRALYHNNLKGISVRKGTPGFEELAATHNLILMHWTVAYPPGKEPEPDDGTIVLTWGDD